METEETNKLDAKTFCVVHTRKSPHSAFLPRHKSHVTDAPHGKISAFDITLTCHASL